MEREFFGFYATPCDFFLETVPVKICRTRFLQHYVFVFPFQKALIQLFSLYKSINLIGGDLQITAPILQVFLYSLMLSHACDNGLIGLYDRNTICMPNVVMIIQMQYPSFLNHFHLQSSCLPVRPSAFPCFPPVPKHSV